MLDSALLLLVVLLFAIFYLSCVILGDVVEYSYKEPASSQTGKIVSESMVVHSIVWLSAEQSIAC